MKNKLILLPLIILALMPPIPFDIPIPNGYVWTWVILLAGFAGLYTLFLNINNFIKAITIYLFISCFFSTAVYISFISYLFFIACVYYYVLCTRITNWDLVKRILIVIVSLNVLMFVLQYIYSDALLNFGLQDNKSFGTVGNQMHLSSMLIILTSFLMAFFERDKYTRRNYFFCILIISYVIIQQFIRRDVIHYFPIIRGQVWLETIRLTFYNWSTELFGWGMGTFKITFNEIAKLPYLARIEGAWLQPHNCWLGILFETGLIGFALILCYIVNLFKRLWDSKLYFCVIGLGFMNLNMLYHTPTRQTQCVLIMILFLVFCEYKLREIKI